MKRILLALSIAAGVAGLGFSGVALASCYNGYCPNSSSPVVGGYSVSTKGGCHYRRFGGRTCSYDLYFRPFGNVTPISHIWWYGSNGGSDRYMPSNTGDFMANSSTLYSCPANTARIEVPNGYKADNGRWYHRVYLGWGHWDYHPTTFVCVKTDTY